jgi:hypothetical protein
MKMKTRNGRGEEFRIDIRGGDGEVSRVRVLQRVFGGKFRPLEGEFTEEQVAHFELFAKAAAAVAKAISPPFDADAIVAKMNGSRRKKRAVLTLHDSGLLGASARSVGET